VPAYVDGEGRLYDTFYRRCEARESARLVQRVAQMPFPSPDAEGAYISFSNYEEAVLAWRKQLQTALGHLHLPQFIGRAYPRPRVFKMVRETLIITVIIIITTLHAHTHIWCVTTDRRKRKRNSTMRWTMRQLTLS
jgi:hypothetical protein